MLNSQQNMEQLSSPGGKPRVRAALSSQQNMHQLSEFWRQAQVLRVGYAAQSAGAAECSLQLLSDF